VSEIAFATNHYKLTEKVNNYQQKRHWQRYHFIWW